MIVCQHCDGKGRFDTDTGFASCSFCRGNGMVDSLNGEHPLAATVESLRSELEAERAHVTRLQEALAFWMPGVSEEIEVELNGRAGDDACLLAGFDGDVPEVSWGDAIRSELEAVKREAVEREAVELELLAYLHPNGAIWRIDNCPAGIDFTCNGWVPLYARVFVEKHRRDV
jgi:hypothetical protein